MHIKVRGMNQQQAHQVRTMNVATTAAAHNRVTQHDKDKAKMFVNQQEYDQVKVFFVLSEHKTPNLLKYSNKDVLLFYV